MYDDLYADSCRHTRTAAIMYKMAYCIIFIYSMLED